MKRILIVMLAATILAGCSTKGTGSDTENSTIQTILTRTSVRQFTGEKISEAQLDTLLRAGMAAPTARNFQPWTFIVITEDSLINQLGEVFPYSQCANHPACAIVPCGDLSKAIEGDGQGFWIQDLSAVTENILLAAHAMGLGAVWTGLYPTERYKQMQELMALPEQIIPLCIIPVGYPAEQPEVKQKFNPDVIHYNRW